MDRTEAQAIVDPVTCKIGQYAAVSHADAVAILGQETFDRMMKNAVRKLGPDAGFVYPWNVVDFLFQPSLGVDAVKEMPLVCPTCRGEKIIVGMFPVYAEHVPQSERKPFVEMKCPKCKGAGTISHEQHRQIAAGKMLRAKRRTTGLGLRECAVALCLPDIVDLPYAEQGDLSVERIAEVERLLDVFIVGRDALMACD